MIHRGIRPAQLVVACLVLASIVFPASGALADHADGVYEIPSSAEYWDMNFDIVIVPPVHGQTFNFEKGLLGGNDPNEATPFNSYLKAIEAVIDEWDRGVATFGSEALKKNFVTNVYVAGRDTIPQAVLTDLEILVFTDETEGPILGTAYRLHTRGSQHVGTCVVRSSMWWLVGYTYADMYNVMGQEMGHCFGLGHVGSQGGVDPTSDVKHPEHDMMNGFYTHNVGFAGTHLHCVSNLDVAGLEWNFRNPDGRSGISFMPVEYYGTTCEPPTASPPAPAPAPSPSGAPAPSPSPSPSPSDSPRPEPSESPSDHERTDHERSITLSLTRHLVARGEVRVADGPSQCVDGAQVEVFRRRSGTWWLVATATTAQGAYKVRLPDRPGTYVARVASSEPDAANRCLAAESAPARHRH